MYSLIFIVFGGRSLKRVDGKPNDIQHVKGFGMLQDYDFLKELTAQ